MAGKASPETTSITESSGGGVWPAIRHLATTAVTAHNTGGRGARLGFLPEVTMVIIRYTGDALFSRIERAVEKVKDRLRRFAKALDGAGIPYAVVGGNAVQVWVAQIDEAAVRNTRDVDILLQRVDLPRVVEALAREGFVFNQVFDVNMFLDGPNSTPRDAVHVIFASEKVRADHALPAPNVDEAERIKDIRILRLEALVRMKLTSFRDKDRVHIRDMLEVGLLDKTWLDRLPQELRPRLQELIDTPDG